MSSNPYDIEEAFATIEEELIESMIRNMKRHKAEEDDEGIHWEMWQAKQLESLKRYKAKNKKLFPKRFAYINERMEELIREANKDGYLEQESIILKAIKNGFKGHKKASNTMQAEFFKLNERKLEALIKATTNDMQKAETAILRMAEDKYRQVIFNAQVYANTGAGTYEKAVDMATKDMLTAGLNCVEYANESRHRLKDYADMAIRTASKRAYLQGEGTKRQEWGISTVIVNKRGNPCPKCLPFCGKVLIDDVWSGGKASDGPYPLVSDAIEAGLYHPRCEDSHTTYFEGLDDDPDDTYTEEEIKDIEEQYSETQKKNYVRAQEDKLERLQYNSLDDENQKRYAARREAWKAKRQEENNPTTIKGLENKATRELKRNLDFNIEKFKMKKTKSKDIPETMDVIKIDYGRSDFKVVKSFQDTILELMDEYDTSIERIVPMDKEKSFFLRTIPASTMVNYETYSATMEINTLIFGDYERYMDLTKTAIKRGQFPNIADELVEKYVATHEFAHTILTTDTPIPTKRNWIQMDYTNTKQARKEVQKLYQEYKQELSVLEEEKNSLYKKFFADNISDEEIVQIKNLEALIREKRISKYAGTNADEFFAEAFTDAKLGKHPSEYSKRVQDITDKYFKKTVDSDIIREIKISSNSTSTKGIDEQIVRKVQSSIDKAQEEFHIKLDEILIEDLSVTHPDTPYLCRYVDDNGKHKAVFVLNSGFDFSDFEQIVEEGYKLNYFAGKTLEDHIMHEMAHVMTGQQCNSAKEFDRLYNIVKKLYIPGISGYSDVERDGFETLAEAFVRMKNGENVPVEARKLVEKYILRWKK